MRSSYRDPQLTARVRDSMGSKMTAGPWGTRAGVRFLPSRGHLTTGLLPWEDSGVLRAVGAQTMGCLGLCGDTSPFSPRGDGDWQYWVNLWGLGGSGHHTPLSPADWGTSGPGCLWDAPIACHRPWRGHWYNLRSTSLEVLCQNKSRDPCPQVNTLPLLRQPWSLWTYPGAHLTPERSLPQLQLHGRHGRGRRP